MKLIARALAEAARHLSETSDTARLDAELLMAEALHIDRDKLILSPPSRPVPKRFWTMVKRRSGGEPVAYITGRRAFWNIDLHVGPGVLIPRPDSEVLIASAIEHFEKREGPERILDLGTGPGTLLLAALDIWPNSTGVGIDVSRRALSYAAANARRLGFEKRLSLRLGNWADGISDSFDLVLCTGKSGLDAYRALAPQLASLLSRNGLAAVEIGHDQADAVKPLLARDGLDAKVANDLADHPRAILLTWN